MHYGDSGPRSVQFVNITKKPDVWFAPSLSVSLSFSALRHDISPLWLILRRSDDGEIKT